jgi:excisionase family DNA binding protein
MVLAATTTIGVSAMSTTLEPARAGDAQTLLLSEREAAALLGVSPRSLWSLADAGELPCVRIGRRKLYAIDTLRRFITERESAPRR